MQKIVFFLGITILFSACSSVKIIEKPIVFNDERKELTIAYLEDHYGLVQEEPTIEPKMVVIHWTAIPTFQKSFEAFYEVKLPSWRPDIQNASALNVSAQFLIDQDGTIYRLMPENTMARHVIGLNHCAIGIENVGGTPEMPLTELQLKSNIKLVKYLKNKYSDINFVIGHFEYTHFENHPLWLEKDNSYRTEKTDPGEEFIDRIRKSTKKFNWEPVPVKN